MHTVTKYGTLGIQRQISLKKGVFHQKTPIFVKMASYGQYVTDFRAFYVIPAVFDVTRRDLSIPVGISEETKTC